ncbi:MAG: adenosylcobinamide amidohydrolase [Halanaeroarchaeum sp.]
MTDGTVRDGVFRLHRPGTRWLSTGWNGGFRDADAAYNVTVPSGWDRTDLDAYVADRLSSAGFEVPGPTLLTGVSMDHLVGARLDDVAAYATVGLSNPATLPQDPPGAADDPSNAAPDRPGSGTVNLVVATDRSLDDGGLATLLSVAVEAKTATLTALADVPGTTTDAAVVGANPDGEPATFAGSATAVGAAARACVREAVTAALRSRYRADEVPRSVGDAEHGIRTTAAATVFDPRE